MPDGKVKGKSKIRGIGVQGINSYGYKMTCFLNVCNDKSMAATAIAKKRIIIVIWLIVLILDCLIMGMDFCVTFVCF